MKILCLSRWNKTKYSRKTLSNLYIFYSFTPRKTWFIYGDSSLEDYGLEILKRTLKPFFVPEDSDISQELYLVKAPQATNHHDLHALNNISMI